MRARRAVILLAGLNALLLAAIGFVLVRSSGGESAWHGTLIEPPLQKQPFMLQSADGPVRSTDLHGDIAVLFFGYTDCPDACPLTLARLAEARRALSPAQAAAVRVVLVSVDPEHDTVHRLADYVSRFDTSFVGLTGTRSEIAAITRDYGIFHAPDNATDSTATGAAHGGHVAREAEPAVIAHTTHVLVLDRSGRLALLWSPEIQPEQMSEDLQRLLRR